MVSPCRDWQAFSQAGLAEDYKTAGNYNLFMACEAPVPSAFRTLPKGYSFRLCRRDELEVWKRIVAEEQYVPNITNYYNRVYANQAEEFFRRCLFVCNGADKPVASCFIWRSYDKINTLAWFRVLPEYEGHGLGRALLTRLLQGAEYPVYLHTQPTSVCAIKLYTDFGFGLVTNPVIGYRKNDLPESLPYLRRVMHSADFERLRFVQADEQLHQAALSSQTDAF